MTGGEAVPQGLQRHALADLRHLGGGMTGPIELGCCLPPGAQQVEQGGNGLGLGGRFSASPSEVSTFARKKGTFSTVTLCLTARL